MPLPQPPSPLWQASPERAAASRMHAYLTRHGFDRYDDAWAWSVDPATRGAFWQSIADELPVLWHRRPEAPIQDDPERVPGVRWFPGGTLNYAEHALRAPAPGGGDVPAVIARSQTRDPQTLTWDDLRALTGRIASGLRRVGVGPGDRVSGYLPNIPETLAAMLATASLGAVWTCCAPEMGVAGVLDRLSQVEPTVLLAVDGYRYGERAVDRRQEAERIRAGLPGLRAALRLPYLHPGEPVEAPWTAWDDFTGGGPADLDITAVDVEHPLYVLYSSGTTGKPKAIVHGHGGIVLEHAKAIALHFDAGPGDRFFWYTTTGWMMWNFCVSGLLTGSAVVLFDGDPNWPEPGALWALMAETATTIGGVGAGYLVAGMKAGWQPGRTHDLGALRTLGATGSPLPAGAARWVYREVGGDVALNSFSGGTDVCTGFVGGSPVQPVWAGEISGRCLGADVQVFDDDGRPVVGEEGELVLAAPLPSMPVGFWGDRTGQRYRSSYFDRFPGVWAHGDRATLTDRGTVVITGRSDGTLNRGGVRMGTAEFYDVVEGFDEISDSLVVHVEDAEGGPGELWLFVVAADTDRSGLADRLRAALRKDLSPRHVPDRIEFVPSVPRTLSGKKLEVPVKRILSGTPVEEALTVASVADPSSLEPLLRLRR